MNNLFQNRYRTCSRRLETRDYSTSWWYFVTICTRDHMNYFCDIKNWIIILNDIGMIMKIIENELHEKFPYWTIDYSVIMPNHYHCILNLDHDTIVNGKNTTIDGRNATIHGRNAINRVSTGTHANTTGTHTNEIETTANWWITWNKNVMIQQNTLWYVIRRFKWRTTFEIHKFNKKFKRQKNFYEHIIRNEKSLYSIRQYIENNPFKREKDPLNKNK